jgi:bacillopeptidase F (M6 metalloprotease family)
MKTCNLLRRIYLTSVLLGVTGLLASTAAAQQGGGIITGQVSDSAGAVLSGAGVVITEQSTGASTSLQTNGDGSFTTPSLPIGTYTVNIKAAGFQAEERTGVVLQVDGNVQVNFTLHPGGVNQSVVVSTQVATVDQLSPTLGTVVEQRSIQEVPIPRGPH